MLRVSRAKSRSRLPHQGWENSLCRQDRRRRPFQASPSVSLFQILLINFLCRCHTPSVSTRDSRAMPAAEISRNTAPFCGRSLEWIKISRIKWTGHATWRWTLCAFPTFHWSPQLFPSAPTPQHHTCLSFKSMFKWHDPNMTSAKNGKSLQLYCKRYHVVINFYSSNIQSRFLLIPDFTFWDLKVKMSLLFTNTNYLLLYVEAFQRSHKQMHHLFSMALLSTWLKEDNGFLEHFVQNMGSISLMGCWEKEGWIFLKFSTAQPYLLTRPSAMNKLRKFT